MDDEGYSLQIFQAAILILEAVTEADIDAPVFSYVAAADTFYIQIHTGILIKFMVDTDTIFDGGTADAVTVAGASAVSADMCIDVAVEVVQYCRFQINAAVCRKGFAQQEAPRRTMLFMLSLVTLIVLSRVVTV